MTFFRSVLVVCPVACLLAQTPVPTTAPKPPAAKPVQKKAVTAPKPAAPAAVKPAAPATVQPAAAPAAPAAAPAPAPAPDPLASVPPDQVVLTVGDEKITARDFLQIMSILPEQSRAQASGAGRKQFVENLIRVKVLAQEGRRRKIDQTAKFQTQIALQRDEFLANSTYGTLAEAATVSDETLTQYYQQHKNEFETVRASHILIRFKGSPVPMKPGQKDLTEEQALAKANGILKELAEGGDFQAIARRDSDDGGSGAYGGDLGSFSRGRMVPSFEEVAFSLPIGQLSPPVKTNFGYHIIKVVQRDSKTLDQAKPEIEKKLRPEAAMKAMESIRQSTNVVIAPELVGGAAPPAPAPPAQAK